MTTQPFPFTFETIDAAQLSSASGGGFADTIGKIAKIGQAGLPLIESALPLIQNAAGLIQQFTSK